MAELTRPAPLNARDQLHAVLALRWRLMLNGLRTPRGAMEAISRVWAGLWFTVLGLGGAVGFAFGGWHFIHNGEALWLSVLLWPLFLFWQVFPLAATAFSDHPDLSHLTRYPLSFRAYCFVRVLYGSFDVANLVGSLCILGLTIGIIIAHPALAPLAIIAGLLFIAFNLLLAQMIAAWLEKWLARRRTREMLAVIFFAVIIFLDFLGPITNHLHTRSAAAHVPMLLPLLAWLPPGLPATSLASAGTGHLLASLGALALLAVCALIVLRLLNLRLHAEYAGEVISETAPAQPVKPVRVKTTAAGAPWWAMFAGLDGPEVVIAAKEFGTMRRSPVVFFTLAMPVALMVLFMIGGQLGPVGPYAFSIGAAYAVLTLTNLVFNVYGSDAAGVQLYFISPIRFRQVFAGKNLAYGILLAADVVLLYIIAALFGYAPPPVLLAATLVGLVFVTLCVFAAGNIASLFLPKKMDLARMGRHAARGVSSMIAMAVEAITVGLAGLVMFGAYRFGHPLLGVVLLAALAVLAILLYMAALRQTDGLALLHRETLITELAKA